MTGSRTGAARARTPSIAQRPRLPVDSLAYALLGAARICAGVRAGQTLRQGLATERNLLSSARKGTAEHNDPQAAIHDLAARTLRRRGRADTLLALIGQRVPEPPLMRELLVVSIAMLVDAVSEDRATAESFERRIEGLPYAPFTLVDQAVHAAASEPDLARGKGFVNAVLRTLLRKIGDEPDTLSAVLWGDEATDLARHELPVWWVRRLQSAYPSDWQRVIDASRESPPLVVRVNRRKTTRDDYLARLQGEGVDVRAVGDDGVRFAKPTPVAQIPGFSDGTVSVQDEAAQRAAPLLDAQDGMRVLDACAAPGGKTGHLLERADLDLVAIDSDRSRLAHVRENLDRLDLAAQLVVGDAAVPSGWWDGRPFDRILADVPCTASGILRRHPDIRWLRRESDIASLSRTAQQITGALWSLLNPGGKLLIVTCSVFPEESAQHAASFAARHADAAILPAPGQLLPRADGSGAPSPHQDHDGLFFALFEKMR